MIVTPNIGDGLDGTVLRIAEQIQTDLPVIPISLMKNYRFNPELLNYKEAIILDFCEYYWDWNQKETHFFGENTDKFKDQFPDDDWSKFDDWVRSLDKKVYFKRELLKADHKPGVYPIDYPCWYQVPAPQTKEEFINRPLEAFYFWGFSHPSRRSLHAKIWEEANRWGYMVCDNLMMLNKFILEESNPRKWVTVNIPHYARYQMTDVLAVNGLSKFSLSLPGSGVKCFRSTGESPVNSIVVKRKDKLAWSYEWESGVNCFECQPGSEVLVINNAIDAAKKDNYESIYQVYLNCIATTKKYEITNYVNDYIQPIINNA